MKNELIKVSNDLYIIDDVGAVIRAVDQYAGVGKLGTVGWYLSIGHGSGVETFGPYPSPQNAATAAVAFAPVKKAGWV